MSTLSWSMFILVCKFSLLWLVFDGFITFCDFVLLYYSHFHVSCLISLFDVLFYFLPDVTYDFLNLLRDWRICFGSFRFHGECFLLFTS